MKLNTAGVTLVNAGTDLPTFTLTPNDAGGSGSALTINPTVSDQNDAPVLAISGSVSSFTEDGSTATGAVVLTYTLSDEETTDTQTLTLSDTTNYSLDEANKKVKLTAAGVALLNSSGALPTFTLKTNDGTVDSGLISATPSVTSENDVPVLSTLATFNFTEDAGASTDSVVASYSQTDQEGCLLYTSPSPRD